MLARIHNLIYSNPKKGQATAELAILGSILIMLLAYLVQQGYLYNARQALEMYTFRKALELSRSPEQERGITLTVIRDVISPSFFSSINRQRLMSSASVDLNPWVVYTPNEPEHIPNRQLLQMGEAMIRNKLFFEVPPTKIKIETEGNQDQAEEDKWQWVNSSVRELDASIEHAQVKSSEYNYTTTVRETNIDKAISKELSSRDTVNTIITFDDALRIAQNYFVDDWTPVGDDSHILDVEIAEDTIPRGLELRLNETLRKAKTTTTPH